MGRETPLPQEKRDAATLYLHSRKLFVTELSSEALSHTTRWRVDACRQRPERERMSWYMYLILTANRSCHELKRKLKLLVVWLIDYRHGLTGREAEKNVVSERFGKFKKKRERLSKRNLSRFLCSRIYFPL